MKDGTTYLLSKGYSMREIEQGTERWLQDIENCPQATAPRKPVRVIRHEAHIPSKSQNANCDLGS